MASKQCLAQLYDAQLAKKKAKKQKVKQLLPTTQFKNKPLCIDTSNSNNVDNLESAT